MVNLNISSHTFTRFNIEIVPVLYLFLFFSGLARKEDFPFVTYYCPHCNALNQPKQHRERVSLSNSPHNSSSASVSDDVAKNSNGSPIEAASRSTSPVVAVAKATEIEKVLSDGTDS